MGEEDDRKIFVGGLPPAATEEDIKAYFETFGPVDKCSLKIDQQSQRSRGFAFVTFSSTEDANKVLEQQEHTICQKRVEPKKATPQAGDVENKKIFVGGLDKSTTEQDIRDAFAERGTVTEVFLPMDRETSECKGYAFVSFEDSATATTLLDERVIKVNDKECDIKKANVKNSTRGGFRGGRGGRGGFGNFGGSGGYDMYGGGYGGNYNQYGGGQYGGGYGQNYGGGGGGYGNGYNGYGGGQGGYGGGGYGQGGYGGYNNYGGGQYQNKMKGGRGGSSYQPY